MYINYHYRYPKSFETTSSLDPNKIQNRKYLIILIVAIIIVALLTIAGVIIAIYALVLSTNKTGTTTTTVTTSGMIHIDFHLVIRTESQT
jgi:flagellar basal body-associated protein FliL